MVWLPVILQLISGNGDVHFAVQLVQHTPEMSDSQQQQQQQRCRQMPDARLNDNTSRALQMPAGYGCINLFHNLTF